MKDSDEKVFQEKSNKMVMTTMKRQLYTYAIANSSTPNNAIKSIQALTSVVYSLARYERYTLLEEEVGKRCSAVSKWRSRRSGSAKDHGATSTTEGCLSFHSETSPFMPVDMALSHIVQMVENRSVEHLGAYRCSNGESDSLV